VKGMRRKFWKNISQKNKKIIGIVSAGVAIVAIVMIAILSGRVDDSEKPQAEEIIKVYYDAFEDSDCKKMVELLYPSVIQEEYFETMGSSVEEKVEQLELDMDAIWEGVHDVGAEYSWSITKTEHLDKLGKLKSVASEDGFKNLEAFRQKMSSWYKMYNLDSNKISKAYAVQVEFVLDANGDEYKTSFVTYAYKYENDWYIIDMNSANLSSWIMSAL